MRPSVGPFKSFGKRTCENEKAQLVSPDPDSLADLRFRLSHVPPSCGQPGEISERPRAAAGLPSDILDTKCDSCAAAALGRRLDAFRFSMVATRLTQCDGRHTHRDCAAGLLVIDHACAIT